MTDRLGEALALLYEGKRTQGMGINGANAIVVAAARNWHALTNPPDDEAVDAVGRAWCEANGHNYDTCSWMELHRINARKALAALVDALTDTAEEEEGATD